MTEIIPVLRKKYATVLSAVRAFVHCFYLFYLSVFLCPLHRSVQSVQSVLRHSAQAVLFVLPHSVQPEFAFFLSAVLHTPQDLQVPHGQAPRLTVLTTAAINRAAIIANRI